ncbi:acyltransferase domain-containing protein [Brachybacterium sp. J153]|uniref:acyltransferase domain-containing protein n=1 Tax=Brachybacterium sp. J153 TaxID=3116488 RepID=UPI002E75F128|nr:acyltransferase domain-containing protein [Brachybacterium sp. J153]MEE1618996.1 acyltransferase domain-containing protein [Brachybacterium sp. J153]
MTTAPPVLVESEDELEPAAVAAMLTAPSYPSLLELLGIIGADAEDLLPLVGPATADHALLAEVTSLANQLRAAAGLEVPEVDLAARKDELDALQQGIAPGEGLLAILALTVSTATVRRWHGARGLSPELSWTVLADLGRQMRVHRTGTGRLGLHQLNWVTGNWAGRLVHLGRLQFDLSRRRVARLEHGAERTGPDEPQRWVVGTHIPATGPLDPAEVDASFDAAVAYFTEHYADLNADRPADAPRFGHEFTCDSWLLSDQFEEITGSESNLARFAARWQLIGTDPQGADGALFFTFGLRPPVDPAALPRRTRLERGVADRLADGRGWTTGSGRLLR